MTVASSGARVFISHSREDNVIAYAVRDQLLQKGYFSFLDFESIAGGTAWEQKIYSALSESIALVLCATPKSLESKWVWGEVLIARYRSIPVVPLIMQGAVIPDLLMQTAQAIDFTRDPGRGYEKLFEALKEHQSSASSGRPGSPRTEAQQDGLAIRVVAGIGVGAVGTALKAQLGWPYGLAFGGDGSLYFGDIQGVGIHRISQDGVLELLTSHVSRPAQLAIDDMGENLYAASVHSHVIHKVLISNGEIRTVAGYGQEGFSGDGGPALEASFRRPTGVAVSPSGLELYVADTGNHRIRSVDFSRGGIVETIAGNGTVGHSGDRGPARAAQLNEPTFLELDFTSGSLFFSDRENHCIRKIRLRDGEITTVVGTGEAGFSKDGTAAVDAAIRNPQGLTLTSQGLCFVDGGNDRVRLLRTDGTITTIAGTGMTGFTGDSRDARMAELRVPAGLCANRSSRRLYVADFGHQQIKVLGTELGLKRGSL